MLGDASESSWGKKASSAVVKLLSSLPKHLKECSRVFAVHLHQSLVPLVVYSRAGNRSLVKVI
jgi:hypothetical protein